MSTAKRVSSVVTSRYANALLDLATEKKLVDKVEADMKDLEAMLVASDDLRLMVSDPRISQQAQKDLVTELAKKAKLQTLTSNFLNVLIENGRLNALEPIITAIHKNLAKMRGQSVAQVKVAQDLTAAQRKELEAALSKASGSTVSLNVEVDPSLLGGMVVTLNSRMIDDSVAGKLERLRLAMGSGSNENAQDNIVAEKPKAAKAKKAK